MTHSARGAAAAGLAATVGSVRAEQATAQPADGKPRVVIVTHPGVYAKDYKIDSGVVAKMVEVGMKELTGKTSEKDIWQQVAQPGERITVKWNEMGWRPIETRPELRAVVAGAFSRCGGHDPKKVFLYSRIECKGDAARIVKVPIPNRGEDAKLRKLITDHTDAIVNLPVLKTHSGKGVCISMKNHFGSIANPSTFHSWDNDNDMGKSIVQLNMFPAIRNKTRLIIVDALRPQWDHGPLHVPSCRWKYNGLIFGFDTVAVDAVGLQILEEKRKAVARRPGRGWQLKWAHRMVDYAQEKGLGVADLNRIDLKRVEMKA